MDDESAADTATLPRAGGASFDPPARLTIASLISSSSWEPLEENVVDNTASETTVRLVSLESALSWKPLEENVVDRAVSASERKVVVVVDQPPAHGDFVPTNGGPITSDSTVDECEESDVEMEAVEEHGDDAEQTHAEQEDELEQDCAEQEGDAQQNPVEQQKQQEQEQVQEQEQEREQVCAEQEQDQPTRPVQVATSSGLNSVVILPADEVLLRAVAAYAPRLPADPNGPSFLSPVSPQSTRLVWKSIAAACGSRFSSGRVARERVRWLQRVAFDSSHRQHSNLSQELIAQLTRYGDSAVAATPVRRNKPRQQRHRQQHQQREDSVPEKTPLTGEDGTVAGEDGTVADVDCSMAVSFPPLVAIPGRVAPLDVALEEQVMGVVLRHAPRLATERSADVWRAIARDSRGRYTKGTSARVHTMFLCKVLYNTAHREHGNLTPTLRDTLLQFLAFHPWKSMNHAVTTTDQLPVKPTTATTVAVKSGKKRRTYQTRKRKAAMLSNKTVIASVRKQAVVEDEPPCDLVLPERGDVVADADGDIRRSESGNGEQAEDNDGEPSVLMVVRKRKRTHDVPDRELPTESSSSEQAKDHPTSSPQSLERRVDALQSELATYRAEVARHASQLDQERRDHREDQRALHADLRAMVELLSRERESRAKETATMLGLLERQHDSRTNEIAALLQLVTTQRGSEMMRVPVPVGSSSPSPSSVDLSPSITSTIAAPSLSSASIADDSTTDSVVVV